MGAVYVATDDRFRNTVAVKQAFFAKGDGARAFEREARLLRNLRHPALPGVIDFFEEDGTCYLVMDYVEGDDLSVLLRHRRDSGLGPFPYAAVVAWGDQILDALEFLHRHDPPILHRDVKPQNLKLMTDGQVVLLDFGLSKGAAGEMSRTVNDESISGFTPSYASPEQMRDEGTTVASDLFSLGATLYHLMTGVKPIDAVTRTLKARPPEPDPVARVDALNDSVPAAVADVIECAMQLEPGSRYASANEMREALSAALPDPSELVRALGEVLAQIPEPSIAGKRDDFATARSDSKSTGRGVPEEVDLATPMIAALTEDRRKLEIRMWIAVAIAVLALLVSVGLLVRWRQYKPILDEQAAESAAEAQREAPVPSTGPTNVDLPAIDLGDGVSIAMVRIPPGTFLMGSPTGDRDERPPHRVKITRGFSISMFEITQAQWSRLMPSNPSPEPGPDLPVSNVSWVEAQEFVAKLNERVGGARFRLPTEAEWEYACRSGTTGDYAGQLDVMAWHSATSADRVHPIGTRAPNSWGIFDMHGNVWEWCSDFYGPYSRGEGTDPAGPSAGTYRVIRGGAFDEPGEGCRSSNRNLEPAGKRDGTIGVRIVRELG
jgi:formylglycine-generating enzyme required for sulfatase activity